MGAVHDVRGGSERSLRGEGQVSQRASKPVITSSAVVKHYSSNANNKCIVYPVCLAVSDPRFQRNEAVHVGFLKTRQTQMPPNSFLFLSPHLLIGFA